MNVQNPVNVNISKYLPSEIKPAYRIEPADITPEQFEFMQYRLERLSPLEKLQCQAILETIEVKDTLTFVQMLDSLYCIEFVEDLDTIVDFNDFAIENLYQVETPSDFHEKYYIGQVNNYLYYTEKPYVDRLTISTSEHELVYDTRLLLTNENGKSVWVGGHNLLYQCLDRDMDERYITEQLAFKLALEEIGAESADTVKIEKVELKLFGSHNYLPEPIILSQSTANSILLELGDIMHQVNNEPSAESMKEDIQGKNINTLAELKDELFERINSPTMDMEQGYF